MERLTEHFGNSIFIKWCKTLYANQESKTAPASNAIVRLAAYEDAMPLERAQELAQVEKDGRLAVLPCKVGNKVYEPNKRGFISIYEVTSIHVLACSVIVGWKLVDGICSNLDGFEMSALGKSVFLTREEAEAALKKRKEADDEVD